MILVIAGLGLQAELWFSDDGYRKTLKLRTAVAEQLAMAQGRELIRRTLEASLSEQVRTVEKKGRRAGRAYAD